MEVLPPTARILSSVVFHVVIYQVFMKDDKLHELLRLVSAGLEPRHHLLRESKELTYCLTLPLRGETTLAHKRPHPGWNVELSAGTVRCSAPEMVALVFR